MKVILLETVWGFNQTLSMYVWSHLAVLQLNNKRTIQNWMHDKVQEILPKIIIIIVFYKNWRWDVSSKMLPLVPLNWQLTSPETKNIKIRLWKMWTKIVYLVSRWMNGLLCILTSLNYRKDTEPLYHAFMYSPIILLSSIYPFTQCLSLLVTSICTITDKCKCNCVIEY